MLVESSSLQTALLKKAVNSKLDLRSGQYGFTLVELMVVITILGIMAAFAAPSISGWIADTKTRSVAEALQNGIRLAQTEAVRRGVQVQFVLTDAAPTTQGVATSSTGKNWVIQTLTRTVPPQVDEFVQGAALGGVSNTSLVTEGEAALTFNSMGRLVAPAKGVTYKLFNANKGSRYLNVTVSIAGKIRMCDPKKSLATSPDAC